MLEKQIHASFYPLNFNHNFISRLLFSQKCNYIHPEYLIYEMKFYEHFYPFHWKYTEKNSSFQIKFHCKVHINMENEKFIFTPKHTYIYLYVKIWTVASHFVNACHVLMWKKIKVSFHIPNTHHSNKIFLNGGWWL